MYLPWLMLPDAALLLQAAASCSKRQRLQAGEPLVVPLPAGAGGQDYKVEVVAYFLRFAYHESEATGSSFAQL